MARVAGNSGVGDVQKEGGEEGVNYNKLVGNGNNGGGISKTTVDARTATVGGEDAPEVPSGRREQGSDTDRKYNLGVGGGGGGGGDGGGGVMFVQAHDTSGNRPVFGLLVDLDPRHPAFVAVATFVVILLSACWVRKKFIKKKIAHHVNPTVGGGRVGSGVGGGLSESAGGVYNTHGHRTRSGGRTGGDKATATAQQESLCEVLYDVYAGVVPTGGITSKAVRECGLTVSATFPFSILVILNVANGILYAVRTPSSWGISWVKQAVMFVLNLFPCVQCTKIVFTISSLLCRP